MSRHSSTKEGSAMDDSINEGATAPLPEPIQPSGLPAEGASVAPGQAPGEPVAGQGWSAESGAGYAPYAPQAPAQVYAPAPGAPAGAGAGHSRRGPAPWVIVTAAAVAGLILLALTFGIGVAVGSHASRFSRGPAGLMMQPPGGRGGQNGWQDDGTSDPRSPGDERGWRRGGQGSDYRGYGEHGRSFPRALPSPDTTTQP